LYLAREPLDQPLLTLERLQQTFDRQSPLPKLSSRFARVHPRGVTPLPKTSKTDPVEWTGTSSTFDLSVGDKERGTTFDRFGIVTSWIDGNSQDVYWDDVSYTTEQD